jgi:hypothetical protein
MTIENRFLTMAKTRTEAERKAEKAKWALVGNSHA